MARALCALALALGCAEAGEEPTDAPAGDAPDKPAPADDAAPTLDAMPPNDSARAPDAAVAPDRGADPIDIFTFDIPPLDLGAPDVPAIDLPVERDGVGLPDRAVVPDVPIAAMDVLTARDSGPPPVDIAPAVDLAPPIDRCALTVCGGLCVDTTSDPSNCGGCGYDCGAIVHVRSGAIRCGMGQCAIPSGACEAGFGDCNGIPSDGCEADLTRPESCGRCGGACVEPTPVCAATAGTLACGSGCVGTQRRCSGACVDVATDVANCGACGTRCTAPAGVTATCTAGRCGFTCPAGTHACGSLCASNAAPASCGTACTPCLTPANGAATCVAGHCGIACNPGFYAAGPTTCALMFCGGGAVLCGDGGFCPANSYCFNGTSAACYCLAGHTAITCSGLSCGSSCVFPNWRCL